MDNFRETCTQEELSSLCWAVLFPCARSVLNKSVLNKSVLNELSSIDFIGVGGSSNLLFLCVLHCNIQKPNFFGKASKKWVLDTFVIRLVKNMWVLISEEDSSGWWKRFLLASILLFAHAS